MKRWFTRKDNTKWLLRIDNVDDLRSFNIDEYIPAFTYGGTVIITSRCLECAEGQCGIKVDQLDDSEAEHLLRSCAKQSKDNLSASGKKSSTWFHSKEI